MSPTGLSIEWQIRHVILGLAPIPSGSCSTGMTLITLISLVCYSYRSDMPPKHDINVTIANLHLHNPRLTPVESWSRKLRLSYLVSSLLLVLLISDAKHASSRISDESCTDNQVWGQIHTSAW